MKSLMIFSASSFIALLSSMATAQVVPATTVAEGAPKESAPQVPSGQAPAPTTGDTTQRATETSSSSTGHDSKTEVEAQEAENPLDLSNEVVAAPPIQAPQYESSPTGRASPQSGPSAGDDTSHLLMGIYWDMGVPLGSSADWVSDYSVQGFAFDVRYFPKGNWGLGGGLAWNTFSEKTVSTVTRQNATLTGAQVHELSTTPLTFKGFYSLRDLKLPATPYVSLGLGGSRALRRVDAGISRYIVESWHWTMAPEIGVELPTGRAGSALAALRFNYLFKTSDAPEQLYLNISVGFGFK